MNNIHIGIIFYFVRFIYLLFLNVMFTIFLAKFGVDFVDNTLISIY